MDICVQECNNFKNWRPQYYFYICNSLNIVIVLNEDSDVYNSDYIYMYIYVVINCRNLYYVASRLPSLIHTRQSASTCILNYPTLKIKVLIIRLIRTTGLHLETLKIFLNEVRTFSSTDEKVMQYVFDYTFAKLIFSVLNKILLRISISNLFYTF